jgi:hypothetical protein
MCGSVAKFAISISTILVALIAAFGYFKSKVEPDRGFLDMSQAYVWGDLQGIEFQHRTDKNLQVPTLIRGAVGPDKYDVLGVASNSKRFPYVWIVLNVNAGANGLFIMSSHTGYVLPCDYLGKLKTQVKIDARVLSDLGHHCLH